MAKADVISVNFKIDPIIYHEFQKLLIDKNMSASEFYRECITTFIKDCKKPTVC